MIKHKSLKPIEIDAQFKYRCPNSQCGSEHWLFLNQVKAKGFKIACDCGEVYSIRNIQNVKIVFCKKKPKTDIPKPEHTPLQEDNLESKDYFNKACKLLEHYGFAHKEAAELVTKVYDITGCTDPLLLVKDSLRIFGGI